MNTSEVLIRSLRLFFFVVIPFTALEFPSLSRTERKVQSLYNGNTRLGLVVHFCGQGTYRCRSLSRLSQRPCSYGCDSRDTIIKHFIRRPSRGQKTRKTIRNYENGEQVNIRLSTQDLLDGQHKSAYFDRHKFEQELVETNMEEIPGVPDAVHFLLSMKVMSMSPGADQLSMESWS